MAITSRSRVKGSISSGTSVTTSQLFPMFDLPAFAVSGGPWDSAAVIHATASPLGYNGQDMHHRFMVLALGNRTDTTGAEPPVSVTTNDIIVFYASATDDEDGFVEVARYDGAANDDAILVSGNQVQAAYKFMVVEVKKRGTAVDTVTATTSTFSVESWGTTVR